MKYKHTKTISLDAGAVLLSEKSPFSLQEAYKTLRINVSFSLPGSGCKCVGIISANRGDGKSSIASNLAISLGQINKKVVLIDCDLRLPTIAQKFGVRSAPGLSNYLSGDVSDIPIVHEQTRGIDLITSGNLPPDSTALISSKEMTALIETLKQSYDYIVFDFPPINIVSDAAILSDQIDGYLIVVRQNASEYQMVEETIRQMRFADAKVIGFAFNGKGAAKKSYYKKYYKKNGYYKYYKHYGNYKKKPEDAQ